MALAWNRILPYWPMLAVLAGLYGLGSGWAAILLYHLGIVIGVVLQPASLREVPKGFDPLLAVGGILAGLTALPAVYLMLPWLSGEPLAATGSALKNGLEVTGFAGNRFWLFFAYFVTIHPFLEELGWRSVLAAPDRWIHRKDFEFAAYHILVIHYFFPFEWLLFAAVFATLAIAGATWRYLRKRTGGLMTASLFHAAGDAGTMLAVWLLVLKAG